MNFFKTSILTLSYTLLFQINGLIITKITAQKFGVLGAYQMGNFNNLIGILNAFTFISIVNGIIKYFAEYKNIEENFYKAFNTAFTLLFSGSVLVGLIAILFNKSLSQYAFKSEEFSDLFLFYGSTVLFFAQQQLILAYFTSKGEIKNLAILNWCAGLSQLGITIFLIFNMGIRGAMVSNLVGGLLVFLIGGCMMISQHSLTWPKLKFNLDKTLAIQYFKFGLVTFISLFTSSYIFIQIRDYISINATTQEAGLWTSMTNLSDRLYSLIVSTISVYYFPKVAETVDPTALIREVRKAFKRIIPIIVFISFTVWLTRDIIIYLLLSKEFVPMRQLFLFQMLGLFLRCSAAIFAYLALAKAMIKTALILEMFYLMALWICTTLCLQWFGWLGVSYSYAAANGLYLVGYFIAFRRFIVQMKKSIYPNKWL